MERQTTFLEVAGRRIQEIRGGEGPPILYLHSAAGDATWMHPHLDALSQHFELHAPAHPGFLESQGIETIRDIEDLAFHYLEYLDRKGFESVSVVGLSLGGWIAAELAARWPERVSKLVLVDAVGIWIRERPIADIFALDMRFPERLARLLFHDPSHPAAEFLSRSLDIHMPDEMVVPLMNAMAATAKVGWNPLLHDPRLEGLLHRVRAETLVLWGASDRVTPIEYGERYAKRIPRATLQVVPECGHLLPIERPDAFVEAVRAFLA